jgi:hypothetical protein
MDKNKPKKTIGLLLIATGLYDQFLQPLIESVETHFFPNDDIVIYLFGDKPHYMLKIPSRISLVVTQIKHESWPASTLFRYRHFVSAQHKMGFCDYLFYSDVDMMMVGDVDDSILETDNGNGSDIIVTRHPGFWNNKDWGSHQCSQWSKSYLQESDRHQYVAGGFNGGKRESFLKMAGILADNTDDDYSRGVIAEHNDENHLNWFVNLHAPIKYPDCNIKYLTPSYCMVPEKSVREQFGLTDLKPIIYALSKNHEELRKN